MDEIAMAIGLLRPERWGEGQEFHPVLLVA